MISERPEGRVKIYVIHGRPEGLVKIYFRHDLDNGLLVIKVAVPEKPAGWTDNRIVLVGSITFNRPVISGGKEGKNGLHEANGKVGSAHR